MSPLRDKYFYATFFCAWLAVMLAYQFRFPLNVDVGGPIDRPLLSWVHDPQLDKDIAYRWTTGRSELVLPEWGRDNPVEVFLRVTRWRPNDKIADLTLYINELEFAEPNAVGQGWQEYTLPVTQAQFLSNDEFRITLETDTFIPKAEVPNSPDPRKLGIQLDTIRVLPMIQESGQWRAVNGLVFTPFKLPPFGFALEFVLSALAIYLTLTWFKIPGVHAFVGLAIVSAATAVALVWARPYLTLFGDTFVTVLLGGIALAFVARWTCVRFFKWGKIGASDLEVNGLALLFGLAFVSKLAFLLYPQTISFDLWYHVHRLQDVMRGVLFWSIPSGKNEFGGQPVPYLPSYYLFLVPFAALKPDDEFYLRLVVQISAVILDSVTIFFIYYWLKKYFNAGRAGLFAAWVYLVVPLAFIAISWGIFANIFGQFLTLLLVTALLELFDRLPDARAILLVTFLFALTMLAHTSVFASIAPMFAAWCLLLLVLGRMGHTRQWWWLIACILMAATVAFASYYSEFVGLVASSASQIADASTDAATRNAVGEIPGFWDLLQPARTEFIAVPLYVYGLAILGFAWLGLKSWRTRLRGQFLFTTTLAAWFIAFALLIFVRAEFGFSSRYVNFAMPAIAMCTGITLSAAWNYSRRAGQMRLPRPGQLIAAGLALVLAGQGAYHWFVLVMFKYH